MIYLAAAVSDYFIPLEEMAEHKIQSGSGDLSLTLRPTPKCLGLLKQQWCPQALVVSFKLETDADILFAKATIAISNYAVDCVIANLLHTRNSEVHVIARKERVECDTLTGFDIVDGGDFARGTVSVGARLQIERPLVETIKRVHEAFNDV